MPTVQVSAGEVFVRLTGAERWAAARLADLRIPLRDVLGANVRDRDHLPRRGIRRKGTGLLRTKVGSFGPIGERRSFWCIHGGDELLVIELRPGADWSWIVLEVGQPEAIAQAINRMRTAS